MDCGFFFSHESLLSAIQFTQEIQRTKQSFNLLPSRIFIATTLIDWTNQEVSSWPSHIYKENLLRQIQSKFENTLSVLMTASRQSSVSYFVCRPRKWQKKSRIKFVSMTTSYKQRKNTRRVNRLCVYRYCISLRRQNQNQINVPNQEKHNKSDV